jgi:hypothetical protein
MMGEKLRTLSAILQTATTLTNQLGSLSDALVQRLVRVFARMPAEDRAPILAVLEREVAMRLLTRNGDPTLTGYAIVRANPAARLYVGAYRTEPKVMKRDQIMRATLRMARLILLAPENEHGVWGAATLQAFHALDTAERAALTRHLRDVLALLEGSDAEATARAS